MTHMLVAMLMAVVPAVLGQQPEVDVAAVLRLGDMVQHVDGVHGDPLAAFVEAMAPPASDADKWFITVITKRGCAGCEKLRRDWATDRWLLALANPADPSASWAHYNVYDADDESQKFRWQNIVITGYPTVLVQPPRNGRYGDPATVVYQGVYGGNPEKLARDIIGAIRQYISRLPAASTIAQMGEGEHGGIRPPWEPPPKPTPTPPPVFPDGRPLIPPPVEPPNTTPTDGSPGMLVTVAGTSAVVTVVLTLGVPWLLRTIREWRIARGKPTLLSDEQFQKLLDMLQAIASGLKPPGQGPSDAPGGRSGT